MPILREVKGSFIFGLFVGESILNDTRLVTMLDLKLSCCSNRFNSKQSTGASNCLFSFSSLVSIMKIVRIAEKST